MKCGILETRHGRCGNKMAFDWKNKNVFITGGTGFVGSHLTELLVSKGANVFVLWRSIDPKAYFFSKKLNEKSVMVSGDLRDFSRIREILAKYEIEVIYHVGAQPLVQTAYIEPYETLMSNIKGTINVLESARMYGKAKSIIVASSDKAYGISEELPYHEEIKLEGKFPYDVSKSCADLISRMYSTTYGLPVVVTRFGNIYGAGDVNFSRIIPETIKSLIKNESLNIRSDGKMIREYIYVKDVVLGYLTLAENINNVRGEAFNFSSSDKFSVLEVAQKIAQILGKELKYKILNQAKYEIPEQSLSYEKINKALGWKPVYSFEEGIKESFKWYTDFFEGV